MPKPELVRQTDVPSLNQFFAMKRSISSLHATGSGNLDAATKSEDKSEVGTDNDDEGVEVSDDEEGEEGWEELDQTQLAEHNQIDQESAPAGEKGKERESERPKQGKSLKDVIGGPLSVRLSRKIYKECIVNSSVFRL